MEAYGHLGDKVWTCELEAYGKVKKHTGDECFIPYRFQGQYHDSETGLYYSRFRYYAPDEGMYVSQDPFGLEGGNPTIYSYVGDCNSQFDPFGLECTHLAKDPKSMHSAIKEKYGHTMKADEMREIQNTVDRIKTHSPRYSNDGTPFKNSHTTGNPNSQRLNTGNTYKEWTVKTPGVGNNGARRVVVNEQTGEAFYSHDHYDSFIKMDLGGW